MLTLQAAIQIVADAKAAGTPEAHKAAHEQTRELANWFEDNNCDSLSVVDFNRMIGIDNDFKDLYLN